MKQSGRSIGHAWEDYAARALVAAGLRIIERRYSCRLGEIDLIALDGETLVFVEVRFRRDDSFGGAAATVTATKQRRILNTARHFLMRHPALGQHPIRLDVIALSPAAEAASNAPQLHWIRAAFDAHEHS